MTDPSQPQPSPAPLAYHLAEVYCPQQWADALRLQVEEVLGTSPTVAPGESYVVRGTYELRESQVSWLRLAAQGTSGGQEAELKPGRGSFTVIADVKEVIEGRERILDVLMADEDKGHLGVRARIELEG